MAVIELALMLELEKTACQADVRAFVDLQPELGLDSEIELPLARHGSHRWIGFFTVGDGLQPYFMYRIGVAAHSRGTWRLTVRRRGRAGLLLWDEDNLALPKLWLSGTCPC